MNLNTIKAVERLARADRDIVSLGQGIPSLPVDQTIRHQIIAAITSGSTDAYSDPQGLPALREKIALQAAQEKMSYTADEVIVTAGAIEALTVALKSVVAPGKDEVVIPTPVYAAYFQLIAAAGGKPVAVRLDEAQDWKLDVGQLETAITERTAAIMLCHPNNPTGSLYDRVTLEAICQIALERGITVIIDEVYRNMLYTEAEFYSPAMDVRFKSCLIRVMSFSKDFSLTGWRVGYLQADRERIASMVALHDSLINCAPVVAQYAAIAALDNSARIIARNASLYTANKNMMAAALAELDQYMEATQPAGGYFFFPKLKDVRDSHQIARELALKAGVVVVPGEAFGPGGEGHLRLCFGRSARAVDDGMQRIKNYFTGDAL
jgi:aminotransferase